VGNIKGRYKVKKENINKLKLFLKKINKNGKQHKLGKGIL
tara:strand:- start:240 stop:359 length:120 start_codon:yes stop_codon:yes gene_type:complete